MRYTYNINVNFSYRAAQLYVAFNYTSIHKHLVAYKFSPIHRDLFIAICMFFFALNKHSIPTNTYVGTYVCISVSMSVSVCISMSTVSIRGRKFLRAELELKISRRNNVGL